MKCTNCDDRGEVRTPDGEWLPCPVCASSAEEAGEPVEVETMPAEAVPTVENETSPQETAPAVSPLPDETKPE